MSIKNPALTFVKTSNEVKINELTEQQFHLSTQFIGSLVEREDKS